MKELAFWGCGSRAEDALGLLDGWDIRAVIDNNPKMQGTTWHGIPVISFADFLELEHPPVLLVTPHFPGEILSQLEQHDIYRWILYNDILENRLPKTGGDCDVAWRAEKMSFFCQVLALQLKRLKLLAQEYFFECFLRSGSKEVVGVADFLSLARSAKHPILQYRSRNVFDTASILFDGKLRLVKGAKLPREADFLYIHSLYNEDYDEKFLELAARAKGIPTVIAEDGLLLSIEPREQQSNNRFNQGHSQIIDDGGIYINAHSPSRMENILNSNWYMSKDEKARASALIQKILTTKITKYNFAALHSPALGMHCNCRVLVVDQLPNDKSITYGMVMEEDFSRMLETALKENPGADIYVKEHPVKSQGHFSDFAKNPRIHFLREPMNPLILLEQMDKVYTCTSQMGFEALLCGKEVHVFGMPFYAGWGITMDRKKLERRTRMRTLEEVFYVAYVMCSLYVSFKDERVCEIEQAIDELLELREEYWKQNNIFLPHDVP